MFHVSLLKKATCTLPPEKVLLPPNSSSVQEPELILDHRLHRKNNRVVTQLLVKWKELPAELGTWEDEDPYRMLFPEVTSCGKAVAKGRGNVRNRTSSGAEEVNAGETEVRVGKTTRVKKANVRVSGSEWVSK